MNAMTAYEALTEAAGMAETSKGYPTDLSRRILALRADLPEAAQGAGKDGNCQACGGIGCSKCDARREPVTYCLIAPGCLTGPCESLESVALSKVLTMPTGTAVVPLYANCILNADMPCRRRQELEAQLAATKRDLEDCITGAGKMMQRADGAKVLVPIEILDRLARLCEYGSSTWNIVDALCRDYRLAAAPSEEKRK
jgi:hypothetical protein